jgi:large subunit ribosomal protein L28
MSQICRITGKRPLKGHTVSHANNKTKCKFNINLHYHRFWVDSQKKFVRLRVTTKGMRIIDKLGIEAVLKDLNKHEENIAG